PAVPVGHRRGRPLLARGGAAALRRACPDGPGAAGGDGQRGPPLRGGGPRLVPRGVRAGGEGGALRGPVRAGLRLRAYLLDHDYRVPEALEHLLALKDPPCDLLIREALELIREALLVREDHVLQGQVGRPGLWLGVAGT